MNNALLSTMTIVPTYDQSHLLQSTIDALPELPLLYDSASCRYYVDGGTTQKRIGGEQLFDASRINSVAAGSTSIKNNGDGSFTIVGQGNITESLSSSYTFTHEESVKLFPIGAYTFQYYNVYPYHYMQVKINNTPVISMFSTATSPTLTVTEEWASDPTFQICIGFAGNMDSKIKPGVVRPMLCRVPLVDWQPYVGGIPAPNPEYPMACENTYPSGNYKFEVNGAWYKLALSDDLRSVDGIADRLWIEPRTGKAWVEKHVNVKNLVGTEAWVADTIASDTTKRYRLDGFNGWTDTSVCSHFSRIAADDDTIGYYGSEKSLYLKTDFASVGALKDFLLSKSGAGSPVTVLYELEKAVLCPVSISEIVETEGSTIELEGTVNSCAEDFVLYGKTHQVETTGAQLFDASKLLTHSQGGATVTNNGDGSFTVSGNGTLTSGFSHAIYLENEEVRRLFRPGEIYMAESPTATRPYFEVGFFKNDQNVCDIRPVSAFLKATLPDDFFAPENNLRVRYIFYGASGLDIIPGTIKPMLYQDGDGTWEPYTGTQSSPSPEYPQDIQGVGVRTNNEPYGYRTDVVTRSKNLVNISMISPTYQQIPNGFVLDAATDGRRIARMPCQLQAGVEYAYKFRCHYNMPGHLVDLYLPKIKQYFVENRDGDIIFGTFIPTADTDTFSVYFQSEAAGTGVTAEITELQVEEGNTSTPYQPYAYYTAPIYTQEQVYQGDKIQLVDGKYCLVRNNGKYIFTGAETPELTLSELGNSFVFGNIGALYRQKEINIRSNHFVGVTFENRSNSKYPRAYTYITQDTVYVVLRNSAAQEFTSVQALQDFFKARYDAGNPVYVVFAAEPQTEPLPSISQQALKSLPTYKGTTIIDTTDPLEPEITVSYKPQTDYSKLPGLEVDYDKGIYTRLGAAKNLTAGAQFNRFPMYAGRRRCNVSDDGTITAYYGDPDYKEDGSNGQVMVYQPKFYYQVVPLKLESQTDGIGYHLRRAQYWVSPKPQPGFKLHPAFINASGQEVDHILLSAYESSLYDTSAATYILDDAQVMDVEADKLCSISGARPASGSKQNFTRTAIEQLAQNRGPGWHGDLIKPVSAEQLLMIIEMGMMNLQTGIGQGVVSIADNSAFNCSSITGSTSSLGNGTGQAAQTINEKGGTTTTETASGKTAITWRGTENPWGNIYNLVYGINIWGNGKMRGGQPFICTDFNFAESKNSGNYEGAGFTVANKAGYISAMGYSTKCDWLFIASECLGNSSLPVGDYTWLTENLNGYRIALLGGDWYCGGSAGPFSWLLAYGVGRRYRNVGGRLVYVPTKNYFDLDRVFGNIIYNGDYKKYSLNLPPGNYNWSLQENTFYGSGKYALFTDDLRFEGGSVVSGKIYRWIGHSTQESYCFTSGTFTITDEMYIAVYNGNVDAVKSLLKTLRIEKA